MISWEVDMARKGDDHLETGRAGERIALRHLKRQGLRLLARNFRCRAGELDLVMCEGRTLVVVEVRTLRRRASAADPLESIGPKKRHQLVRVTRQYLGASDRWWPRIRFDVVGVTLRGRRLGYEVCWLPDAFDPADY
jgi:putative endonuclease